MIQARIVGRAWTRGRTPLAAALLVLVMSAGGCGSDPASGVRTPDGATDLTAPKDSGVTDVPATSDTAKPDAAGSGGAGGTGGATGSGGASVDARDAADAPSAVDVAPEAAADLPTPDTGSPADTGTTTETSPPPDAGNDQTAAETAPIVDAAPVDTVVTPDVPPDVPPDTAPDATVDSVTQVDEVGGNVSAPVAGCRKLVATLCARDGVCIGQPLTPTQQADCETAERVAFGCDRASLNQFGPCQQDVDALSCAALFPPAGGVDLPASCIPPLDIPLSPAQTKCVVLVQTFCQRNGVCLAWTPTQVSDCVQTELQNVPCQFVVDVSPTYDQCIADLGAESCVDLAAGTGPTSCTNVLVSTP